MNIRIKEDAVRLRTSPEFLANNILTLLPRGTIFTKAVRQGDWWQVTDGFIHASMVEEIKIQATLVNIANPADPLTVPYRSQWDVDANNRSSDCGQSCVAMLAEWRGVQIAINDLRFQQLENGVSNATDLFQNFASINLAARIVQLPIGETPPLPAICLIWYGGLARDSVQDKRYVDWHWLVLLGQRDTEVITHDPNYWDQRRKEGAHKSYSLAEWQRAFIPYAAGTNTLAVVLA